MSYKNIFTTQMYLILSSIIILSICSFIFELFGWISINIIGVADTSNVNYISFLHYLTFTIPASIGIILFLSSILATLSSLFKLIILVKNNLFSKIPPYNNKNKESWLNSKNNEEIYKMTIKTSKWFGYSLIWIIVQPTITTLTILHSYLLPWSSDNVKDFLTLQFINEIDILKLIFNDTISSIITILKIDGGLIITISVPTLFCYLFLKNCSYLLAFRYLNSTFRWFISCIISLLILISILIIHI